MNSKRTQRRFLSRRKADQHRAKRSQPAQAPLGENRHRERAEQRPEPRRRGEQWRCNADPGRDLLSGLDWLKEQDRQYRERQGDLLDKRKSASR